MYSYLAKTNCIDHSIQKGFWRGVDGVTEHTSLLFHIMNDAFNTIHLKLIVLALRYHHLLNEFVELFLDTYNHNYVTIAVGDKWTNAIKIEKGVLQGDPSSPLLFNLCFDTFMHTINQPQYLKLGYSWGPRTN